jgi:anti-anti-sigma factor
MPAGAPEPGPPQAREGHLMLLHRSERERLLRLAEWVRAGIERDEKVVYVEPADAGPAAVLPALHRQGFDVDALAGTGRLQVLAPELYYAADGQAAVVDRALDEGFAAVRVSGAATAALGVVSLAEHVAIERAVDELCRSRPVSVLCQYAYPATSGERLSAVLGMHPSGVRELFLAVTATPSTLVLRGDVDVANLEVLEAALTAALARAAADRRDLLRVDLAGVAHLGAAACRALARAAERFAREGGRLDLVGVRPAVARVLRLCGLAHLLPDGDGG